MSQSMDSALMPFDATRPDDVRFIWDALEATARLVQIDRNRLCATGFSGGGRMLSLLASELALAVIAPVGGLRGPAEPPPSRPVHVIAFHGLDDPVNPYGGGGPPYWRRGVEDAVQAWVEHNGLESSPRIMRVSPSVTRTGYGVHGPRVLLYQIEDLGHQWPGSSVDIGEQFGPVNGALCATGCMFEYFAHTVVPEGPHPR